MKKIILSAAMLLAIGFSAKAQDIKFGVKAGLNVATLTGESGNDVKSRTGFHAGVVAEFKVTQHFSIQPELLYSEQGDKEKGFSYADGYYLDYTATTKLDYINLPVLAKYYIIEGFSIEAGPQVGFLVNSKVEGQISGEANGTIDSDIKSQVKSVDFGLVGGLAYDFPKGLFFQARYNAGISKVNQGYGKAKNGVMQFSVGYKF